MNLPPLVYVAAAFAAGIILHSQAPAPFGHVLVALCIFIGAWMIGLAMGQRAARALLALAVCAALGYADAAYDEQRQPVWPPEADGRFVVARGVVHSLPESRDRGWRATLRLSTLAVGDPVPPRRRHPLPRDPPGALHSLRPGPETADRIMRPAAGLVRLTGRGPLPAVGIGDEAVVRGHFRIGRPAGNPGERSERDAMRRHGLAGVIAMRGLEDLTVLRRGGPSLRGGIAAVRRRVVESALRVLPAPHSGLFLSLLLGIETYLPVEISRQFTQAGLIHLMVVSGMQVAIVASALAAVARLARVPPWATAAVAGSGVGLFAAMAGWAPSIGRAVIMTGIALFGTVIGRERDPGTTLAATAVGLLAAHPPVLFDIGFQLSFAATWGLLFLAPVMRRHLARLGPMLSAALGVTVGAQVAVAPLLAAHFQALPAAGLVANVVALPLVAMVVPGGFLLVPLLVAVPAIGVPLFAFLRPPLDLLLWIAARFGGLSWATLPTPPVSPLAAVATYAVLGGIVCIGSGSWQLRRPLRPALVAAAVLAASLWYTSAIRPPDLLTVIVLDVGQGDAILIQSPSGRSVLIDGGGELGADRSGWDIGRMRVVPALRRASVRRVDVLLLSHPHEDHVGGLPAVVENFPVGLVLDPGVPHPSPSYTRLLRLIEAGRIPYHRAREGLSVDLGGGALLAILYPPEDPPAVDGDPVHARGVVARLTYGRFSMLLTGDIEAPVERYLIDRGTLVTSRVLKVGHHGSRTSTTPAFVSRVRPQIAVISVGAFNAFGHPHPATLETLAAASVQVHRTDREGAIRISSNGTSLGLTSFRGGVHAGIR